MPGSKVPPDQAAMNLWTNLQYLRNAFRLTDTEIARGTGIRRTTMRNKLEGLTPLTYEEALLLSEFFGATLEVLQMPRAQFIAWVANHWDATEQHVRSRCGESRDRPWRLPRDHKWSAFPVSA